jgi:transcriptional regulator with XRE-family HTH domain
MADEKIALWIQEALRSSQMSQAELARRLGERLGREIDRSMVQKVLKGVRRLPSDELIAIAEISGLAPPTGAPRDAKIEFRAPARRIDADATPEFDLRGRTSRGRGHSPSAADRQGGHDGGAAQEEWRFPKKWLEEEMRLTAATIKVVVIVGSAMAPDLLDGDRVLIDRTHRDPRQGGIFAIREGDGFLIKHVELLRDAEDKPRIRCTSSNPAYRPFELVLDGTEVEIIGRVAGRITRM